MLSAWSAEGFAPSEFWEQTPETWGAIMDGRRQLREHQSDMMIAQAWWAARFSRTDPLEPLSRYLARKAEKPTMSIDEALAQWDALEAAGYALKVERLN